MIAYSGVICFIVDNGSQGVEVMKSTQESIEYMSKSKLFFVKDFNVNKDCWDYRVIHGVEMYIGFFSKDNPVLVVNEIDVL